MATTKKLAVTRPANPADTVDAELQATAGATDLTALISTMTSNTPAYNDPGGPSGWAAKLLARFAANDNLLAQLVALVFSKVSTVNGASPDGSGNVDLTAVFAPAGRNVVYRHGAPTDPTAYPVGTFVVDVDDLNHLYEIGA